MRQRALPMPRGTEATTLVLLLSCGCDFWTIAASSKRIQFHSYYIFLLNLTDSSFVKRPVNNIQIPELVSIRIFTSEPSFRHHEMNRARCQLQIFIDQVTFFIIFWCNHDDQLTIFFSQDAGVGELRRGVPCCCFTAEKIYRYPG
jgi:hypothetical protein